MNFTGSWRTISTVCCFVATIFAVVITDKLATTESIFVSERELNLQPKADNVRIHAIGKIPEQILKIRQKLTFEGKYGGYSVLPTLSFLD